MQILDLCTTHPPGKPRLYWFMGAFSLPGGQASKPQLRRNGEFMTLGHVASKYLPV